MLSFTKKIINKIINKIIKKSVIWYLFPQQANDSTCHCLFIYNLALLKTHKAEINNYQWRTQEEWVGVTFAGVAAWQQAMNRLTNPLPGENTAFCEYQKYLLQHGIHLDQIFTDSGKMYYKSSFSPFKNLQKIWLSPYHFVCAEKHPDAVEKTLPVYSNGSNGFIFDAQEQCYKILSGFNINNFNINKKINKNIKSFSFNSQEQEYLGLPENIGLTAHAVNNLDFKYGYKYQYLPAQAKKSIYFHVGLFQLLNLAMGLDRENNFITQNHELYPVYDNLRTEMQRHPENAWGLPEFNANNNLEYHLTELFKQDPKLMQEVIDVNKYPFNTYEHYENLDNLYNSNNKQTRQSLASRKALLPGKEQILAYSFSQSLLTIWTAAVSEKALYSVLELPVFLRFMFYFANRAYHKKILKTVYEHKATTRSFMQIWQHIQQLLQAKGIQELFSFDGHGVVVSFSEALIKIQNEHMNISAPKLMADLGFTVIDSLYADSVSPWYTKIAS